MTNMIGPHEYKELELMLQGVKPVALITCRSIEEFKPYIKAKVFVCKRIANNSSNPEHWSWCIARVEEKSRIEKIEAIYANCRAKNCMEDKDHAAIGNLLGYTEQQINAFLEIRS